jgi:hypothetical protein
VYGGRVCAERTLPPGGGAHLEIEAGLAATRRPSDLDLDLDLDLDELFLVGQFLRKPPPEVRIVPLEKAAILRAAAQVVKHAAPPPRATGLQPSCNPVADLAEPLF